MFKKKNEQPARQISHFEETWNADDFKEHERMFQEMHVAFKKILEKANGNMLEANWMWLEHVGVVKIREYMGAKDYVVTSDSYAMEVAKFGKYKDWAAFNEQREPGYPEKARAAMDALRERLSAFIGKARPPKPATPDPDPEVPPPAPGDFPNDSVF